MALRNLGVPFEHYLMSEWEMHATASYKSIHMADDNTDYSADMTSEEVTQALIDYGISVDGKQPLTIFGQHIIWLIYAPCMERTCR